MGSIFGKSKKTSSSRVTEQDKAVLQLKLQRDKLKQYQKRIQGQLEKDFEVAKELLKNGRKDKAKLLLRKKKFQETLLERTNGQLDNIEQLVHDIEYTQIEVQVVAGLDSGNKALKKLQQLISLDDVHKIMEETQESIEYQKEIDALLAGGLTQADEDDVLQELNEIIKETSPARVVAGEPLEIDNVELPDVPKTKLKDLPAKRQEAVLAS